MTTSSEPLRPYAVEVTYVDRPVPGLNCRPRRKRVEQVAAADALEALRDVATSTVARGFDVRGLVVEHADMPTEPEGA